MRKNKGFTLVEILIVVVILGILAAIVIPQFTDASTQSKVASCQTSLMSLRSQIELYKIQHNDTAPGGTAAAPGTFGEATWIDQMTTYSDASGNTGTAKTAVLKFGPYIQQVPTNPWNSLEKVVPGVADAALAGWIYDITTGDMWISVFDLATSNPTVHAELVADGTAP
jgi:general secretion pathway protein G